MSGRFGPGCCCSNAFCTGDEYADTPSEVIVDFDTTDFDNDVIDSSTTGWTRSQSGDYAYVVETFGGSTLDVVYDNSFLPRIATSSIGYVRQPSVDPSGLVPNGARPFTVAELEFKMTDTLTYSWNWGFPVLSTSFAGFALSIAGFELEYVAGYNFVSFGSPLNGRMYRLRANCRGVDASGTPQTVCEVLNVTAIGLPSAIISDGQVCTMRVTSTGATTADVELIVGGVTVDTGSISGVEMEDFNCDNFPAFGHGGKLQRTDAVTFEIDDLRWEMVGTP